MGVAGANGVMTAGPSIAPELLREGSPADLLAHIDGALLVDVWSELAVRAFVADWAHGLSSES